MQINIFMVHKAKDPVVQKLKRSYNCAKNQAVYRGQQWSISFEEYVELWTNNQAYLNKGRGKNQTHLSRINPQDDWHINNVQIVIRGEHLRQRMLQHYAR